MKNTISQSVTGLIPQARAVINGLTNHADTIELVIAELTSMSANLDALTGARDGVDRGKIALREKYDALHAHVKSGADFVRAVRDLLINYLGKKPSVVFASLGYEGSLALPRTHTGMIRTLEGIKRYFADNPTHENAPLNLSTGRANNLLTDINNAVAAVNKQKGDLRVLRNTVTTKAALVRKDLRSVLAELRLEVDPLSDVWERLGLNRPGVLQAPEVPQNVVAVLIGPNAAAVKWDRPERGRNYRIWKKVVGVDTEFVPVDSRSDLDFTIEGLPSGATIEIAVSATNSGGESALSEAVTVVTPA